MLKTLGLLRTPCNYCKSCCTVLCLEEKNQRVLLFKKALAQTTNWQFLEKILIREMSREAMLFQVTREVTC